MAVVWFFLAVLLFVLISTEWFHTATTAPYVVVAVGWLCLAVLLNVPVSFY